MVSSPKISRTIDILCIPGGSEPSYLVAVGGANGVEVQRYPMDINAPPISLLQSYSIAIARFSHSGKYLSVAAQDGHIGVWSVDIFMESDSFERQALWHSTTESACVTALEMSPDDSYLAIGHWDGTLSVYSANEGKIIF